MKHPHTGWTIRYAVHFSLFYKKLTYILHEFTNDVNLNRAGFREADMLTRNRLCCLFLIYTITYGF